MKNTTPLIKNIKYVCITLMLLFNIHFTYSQVDLRTCGFDCTSNNYTLTDVYLSLSDVDGTPIGNTPCTIGDVQQVYIYLNYTSNANSSVYYARLNADLNIGGVTTFLNVYLGQIVPGSNIKLLYGPFDWVCGDELDLTNTIIAWKTSSSNNPGENYQCNSFSNAQCDYTNAITISKPLAVQFTYTACTVGSETTVNFTSTTNGGKEPYTYAWDFDNDGGPVDSTLPNPTHVYTTQNNTAKLTVTDFENVSNYYTVLIVQPTELMLSESHTSVGCSGGTSSITLTVSGGTPGYTYLWNTGATTKDLADVPPGDYNVTVTDSYNCSKQLFVTIEDGDTVIPVIDPLPDPSTINCPESPSFAQATATDNSGSISSLTYTDETTPGSCPGTYSITRTWIAKDACNNESLPVSQTITVEDTTPPGWITGSQDLDVILECSDSEALAAAQLQEPVAEDSCNDVSYTKTEGSFVSSGCANSGTYTNTWVATDLCGNVSEVFTQIITIEDTTAPVWLTMDAELNITLECSDLEGLAAAQAQQPVATDNCDGEITYTKTEGSFVSSGCVNAGTYTNTWIATDLCGNVSEIFTQVITIEDTTAPLWSTMDAELNVTLECSDLDGLAAAQAQQPVATDNCDGEIAYTKTEGSFVSSGCANSGTYTNTWVATDLCGNVSEVFTQIITIEDTTAPLWSTMDAELDITLECSDLDGLAAAQAQQPVATDNCDGEIVYTKTEGSFVSSGCANAGTYTNTWIATDLCGNVSEVFTQIITIEDTTAPVWSTMDAELNITLECSDIDGLAAAQAQQPVATDNCDGEIAYTKTEGSFVSSGCNNSGTYTNTWIATDLCGNVSEVFTQIITIEDTTAPMWNTASSELDITFECSDLDGLAGAQAQQPVATDNCDGEIAYTKTEGSFVSSGCDNSGTYTNTWIATDLCGNVSEVFTQIITIEDTTAPLWSSDPMALDITLECSDLDGLDAAQAQQPVATDNCDGEISYTKTEGSFVSSGCANAGTYTNTWIATDLCGNVSEVFTQIITIEDTTAPVWSTMDAELNITLECSDIDGLAAAQAQQPVATDNCDGEIAYTKTEGSFVSSGCNNSGTYTNTWIATDLCGNVSEVFTQIITIEDTTAPVWSTMDAELNITLECSDIDGLAAAQAQQPVATDNCDGEISYTKTEGSFVSSGCANAGTYTNTWVATDLCGNVSEVFTQIITIEDTTAPVWSTMDAEINITLECSDLDGLAAAQAQQPVATDNCDGEISYTKTEGSFVSSGCANAGTYTNTWVATDLCGNVSEVFTQIITIEDTTAPVWSTMDAELNITLECSDIDGLAAAQAQQPVATDNCDGEISYTKTEGSFVSSGCANAGTYTNTWVATDLCGNVSEVFTQIITIEDTTAPVWSTMDAELNITLECSDIDGLAAAQAQQPVATDNCDGEISYTKTEGSFVSSGCVNARTYTNTWIATDECGNVSDVFTQIITIEDTTAPVWSTMDAELNITLECSDLEGLAAAQAQQPVATDNCDGEVAYTKTEGSFVSSGCANSGTYTNTWVATDLCGNVSEVFTQIITIEDTTAPVWLTMNAELNVTLECSDLDGLAAAQAQQPVATDNCDGEITYTKTEGSFVSSGCVNAGTYTNTWIATDLCGNVSDIFTQIITIEDTTAPVWSTASSELDITLECSDLDGLAVAQAQQPVATDNCDGEIVYTKTSGEFVPNECPSSGSYTNTWVATDECGNISEIFTQIITIQDTTKPLWITPDQALDVTIECNDAEGLAAAQAQQPVATDNCDGEIVYNKTEGSFVSSGCANSGTYTNTWIATDLCGNVSEVFTQIITIEDTTATVWNTASSELDITLECSDLDGLAAAQAQQPVATDNCDGEIAYTKTEGSFVSSGCVNAGTYTNTWIATDLCGNVSEIFTQIITIEDTTAPLWSTMDAELNVTLECSDLDGLAAAQAQQPVATDNCDGEIAYTKTEGSFVSSGCVNAGTYTNTWIATDLCGNVSQVFTQIITIEDTTTPLWSTMDAELNITLECSDLDGLAAAQAQQPVATDNCDGEITYTKTEGSFVSSGCANAGTYTNTWIATDICGNVSEVFTQIITIEDTTAPVWSTMDAEINITLECSDLDGLAAAQAQQPVATDNCDGEISYTKTEGSFVSSGCANAGTYTNTWVATDLCGNVSEVFTQIITIEDTTAPVWSTMDAELNITLECSDIDGLAAAQAQQPVATDNCDGEISYTKTEGSFVSSGCANAGTYTNTWVATDLCGNVSEVFTQIITIEDTTAPVWSTMDAELNITLECSDIDGLAAAQAQQPVATDNCDGEISYTKTEGSFVSSGCVNARTYTNTWIATDECGNVSDVFTQIITIEDTTAPVWSTMDAELNITLECSDLEGLAAAQAQQPVATDNCDGEVAYTKTEGSFVSSGCANSGTYTNTWVATDLCGNVSEVFTQIITIEDTTAPVWLTMNAELNVTLECSDLDGLAAAQAQQPVATDNCDGEITYTKTEGSFVSSGCVNAGTYTNTWIATDLCGNVSDIFTQIITIEDTTAPVWSTASSELDITLECSDLDGLAVAQAQQPVATDNCDGEIVYTKTSGEFVPNECPSSGSYTNTWVATDECGNISEIFTQIITIQDTTKPLWITPDQALDVTIECNDAEGLAAAQAQQPVATDNCDGEIVYNKTEGSFVSSGCANSGTYTNTWIATDLCGNVSEVFTQIITIEDTTATVWNTASSELDITLECSDLDGLAAAQAQQPVATDNCDGEIVYTKTEGSFVSSGCVNAGTYTNTWIATDLCGNVSQVFTQIITIEDTTATVWNTASSELDITLECSDLDGLAAAQAQQPVATDNCDGEITYTKTEGSFVSSGCANAGTYTNTWIATDICGNVSEVFTQIITIEDTTAPVWSTASSELDITLECSNLDGLAAAQAQQPVATDNCDGEIVYTKTSGEFVPNECPSSGSYTNTWVATDECGNISEIFTQIITIQDTTKPLWITPDQALDVTIECNDAEGLAAAQALEPLANDNCDGELVMTKTEGEFVSTGCGNAGTYTNMWTVTDVCGNFSKLFTQIIVIEDTSAPVWSTVSQELDITIECSDLEGLTAAQAQQPVATDNCDSEELVYTKTEGEFVSSGCGNAGTYTNTWVATDLCGNESETITQVITIEDTTAPVWNTEFQSLDMTLECSDLDGLASSQAMQPMATDNCNGEVTYTETEGEFVASGCGNAGTYTNTWVATDLCGNISEVFTQIITIEDTTAPLWSTMDAELNVTLECSDLDGLTAAQAQQPVSTDNCDGEIVYTKTSGEFVPNECPSNGSYTNTWVATDECGNVSEVFTQIITIQDTTKPLWITPDQALDVTIECNDAEGLAAAQAMEPLANDNCGGELVMTKTEGEFVSTGCGNAGTYTNMWTVTDVCGNFSKLFTQIIVIEDTSAPVWSTVSQELDITLECSDLDGLASAQAIQPVATDNCDSEELVYTKTEGEFVSSGCGNAGTYTNTWVVTDLCGNESETITQVITIEDTTAPVWNTEFQSLDMTLECSDIEGLASAQLLEPVADDNCDGEVTYTETEGEFVASGCGNAGTYTNTWIATDICGNVSEVFTQIITIEDTTPPSWTTEPQEFDITLECSDTEGIEAAQQLQPVAADNCDGEISYTKSYGEFVSSGCDNEGTYTNTWVATDECGNVSAIFTQVITIEDTTAPVFVGNLPPDMTVSCDDVPEPETITASDNCNPNAVSISFEEVRTDTECDTDYVLSRIWTVTDCAGNSIDYTQIITVMDTTPPTGTPPADITDLEDISDIPAPNPGDVTDVTDNCSEFVNITIDDTDNGDTGCVGAPYVVTRTYTLSDCAGNVTTLVQTITVLQDDSSILRFAGTACNEETAPVNLFDFIPQSIPQDGTWLCTNSNIPIDRGSFINVYGLAIGDYTFDYIYRDETCPSLKLNLNVEDNCKIIECEPILVHNAFSPNGDNINETFVIDNIDNTECYPDNSVEIYNRWGILVFETRNYNNTSNAFDGISRGRTTVNKSVGLPTGTYFYILNYTSLDGKGVMQTNSKSGYLFLSR